MRSSSLLVFLLVIGACQIGPPGPAQVERIDPSIGDPSTASPVSISVPPPLEPLPASDGPLTGDSLDASCGDAAARAGDASPLGAPGCVPKSGLGGLVGGLDSGP
jgi:hypothetical protein